MKNIPEVKIGLVIGTTDWMSSDVAVETGHKLVEYYNKRNNDDSVYECSVVLTDNEINVKRAIKELTKAGCDAACLYFANYGPESAGTRFAEVFNGPVMFLAAGEDGDEPYEVSRKDSLSGYINACYALKLRKTDVYIPSKPIGNLEECADMLCEFTSVARTLIAVNNLKVISFGPRPSSYLASSAPNHLVYDLGIDIGEYSELELLESFKKHDKDTRIDKTVQEMKDEIGEIKIADFGILEKLAQYELTVEDWIRNYKGDSKYVTLTSTCWPAFPVSFGVVPCYVNSRLTAKGFPVACEVDVYGAISEYIGQVVSGDSVTILNINNDIPETIFERIKGKEYNEKKYKKGDLFLGYHCGVTPVCRLSSSSLDYHFVNRPLIGEERSRATIQGGIKPGPVTIFRIQGMRDGILRAYVAQGQILPERMDTYGGHGIIAIPEMERFIRNVIIDKHYPNHCAILFGHYGKELISICRLLGIEDIDYNHPADMLYDKENYFITSPEWY